MTDQTERKRITFFERKEFGPLDKQRMPTEFVSPATQEGLAKLMSAAPMGAGEKTSLLFCEPGATGMSLVHVWFKSGYRLPAHSHSTDCLYYVLSGELRMGARVLRAGDGFLIPAEQAYSYEAGPDGVEVLEFRNATTFNILVKDVGESRWDDLAEHRRERAVAWASETAPPSARG